MKIILAGYMGSGKTAVGTVLAQKTGLPFIDLDEQISDREGKDIPEIFKTSGEIYFRKREAEILLELLNSEEDFILALGGGTPCYGKNLSALKENEDVKLIYLKTSLQELLERLYDEREKRPVISHLTSREELEDFVRKHLFERAYYYNQSEYIISTNARTTEEIAAEIMGRLN